MSYFRPVHFLSISDSRISMSKSMRTGRYSTLSKMDCFWKPKGFFADGRRERIIENLKSVGYTYVTLDAGGFRSGSMNDVLEVLPLIQG